MAAPAADEIMVHDSIEAKGDADVDMEDAPADAQADIDDAPGEADTTVQADVTQDDDLDADGDVDAEGEAEDDEPTEPARGRRGRRVPDTPYRQLLTLIDSLQKYLCEYEENGEPLAAGFQRLPKKNELPDYYEVIKEPVAFSTVRSKLLKKQYTEFTQFVRDVAQICHNAQVFNRPSAPIFQEAVRLREVFKDRLQQELGKGTVKAEEISLPYLGELPPAEDSPPPDSEDEEAEEEEDDDEEEDDEDSDDEDNRRRGRRRGRTSRKGDDDDDYAKKRGRPPKVFTPTEARINAILKGLRKPRNDDGDLRILPFERLPDKQLNKDYYQAVSNPIALDQIKRNAKRKKYRNVDEVLTDLDLMFENAMLYNEEGSDIYDDAVELQKEARRLVAQEKSKSDEAFRDEEGKLPLLEVEHHGEIWKVGDWIHIRNPNDLRKPIVAQIYRLWQDEAGKKWINACWYYRPEQTVHRVTKRFYKNEVMKTGQYRDHLVDDIVDRCFVMFHTRYHRGRPRGFPADKEIYGCEARYNEDRYTFNRIKTWTSCLPDEVRERDYEMDLYPVPRRLKKEQTPIAHLLADNAKEADPLPKPNWGHKDAPPIIGGVHMRPREPNDSPSPEPTPEPPVVPPPPMAAEPIRRPSMPMPMTSPSPAFHSGAPGPAPSPSPAAHHFQHQHFAPPPPHRPVGPGPSAVPVQQHTPHQHQQYQQHQQQQYQQHPPQAHQPHVPAPSQHYAPHQSQHQPHPGYYQQQPQQPQQPHFAPSATPVGHYQHLPATFQQSPFSQPAVSAPPPRVPMAPTQNSHAMPQTNAGATMYNPPRPNEVYTLRDEVDMQIPAEVREQYQTDDKGRILFFTAPPLNRPRPGVAEEDATLGHSVRYLADLREVKAERERKRKERDEALKLKAEEEIARRKEMREEAEKEMGATAGALLGDWILKLQHDNEKMEKDLAPIRAEKAAWEAERATLKQDQTA